MEPGTRSPHTAVVDPELIADFRVEFDDAFDNIQGILVKLDRAADKHEDLHGLFRALHSVKSNLRMMQLDALSEFVHAMEDILDDMRSDKINYVTPFSDVSLLCLERVRDVFTAVFAGDADAAQLLDPVKQVLARVHTDHARYELHLQDVLVQLDPTLVATAIPASDERPVDLDFFKQMAVFIERRLGYAEQSLQRMLLMAEQMNALAGNTIDVTQLRAAVYVHDVGMAFLPPQLLGKQGEFSTEERHMLRSHADLGADLLDHLTEWYEASQMVRHHHERQDGQGYPRGLAGQQICAGAKLLAIVDTFEAMTQSRIYREQKRTVLRVVAEINAQVDQQFDRGWVEIFNQWARKSFSKAK